MDDHRASKRGLELPVTRRAIQRSIGAMTARQQRRVSAANVWMCPGLAAVITGRVLDLVSRDTGLDYSHAFATLASYQSHQGCPANHAVTWWDIHGKMVSWVTDPRKRSRLLARLAVEKYCLCIAVGVISTS